MRYTSKQLTSKELLVYLEASAKLRTIWRGGKQVSLITITPGQEYQIQYSLIRDLLKSGVLHSITFSGGEYTYYLEGHEWHEALLVR